ncbi:hypothetical protein TNCV_4132781 [Trichonephila clavipes]|nr:hypothetical protein TNCV_4132781 [Trichonephila clavipes]
MLLGCPVSFDPRNSIGGWGSLIYWTMTLSNSTGITKKRTLRIRVGTDTEWHCSPVQNANVERMMVILKLQWMELFGKKFKKVLNLVDPRFILFLEKYQDQVDIQKRKIPSFLSGTTAQGGP